MTVKKALDLTDWLLQNNTKFCKGLTNPEMLWNDDTMLKKLGNVLMEMTERDSKVLKRNQK